MEHVRFYPLRWGSHSNCEIASIACTVLRFREFHASIPGLLIPIDEPQVPIISLWPHTTSLDAQNPVDQLAFNQIVSNCPKGWWMGSDMSVKTHCKRRDATWVHAVEDALIILNVSCKERKKRVRDCTAKLINLNCLQVAAFSRGQRRAHWTLPHCQNSTLSPKFRDETV